MVLLELLGKMPKATFINDYYYRLPFAQTGGARGITPALDLSTVDQILQQPGVDAFLARQGRMYNGPGAPMELFKDGYTVVVRNAQKHHAALAKLADSFATDFAAPVNVHLYCTPATKSGFGWHYDAEDVFILQTKGVKEYKLRKNTVHPWPLLETIPHDMKYEREVAPFWSCRLAAGDWLYIPPGWWHEARAEEESITLAVGMMSSAAIELLDFLRRELAASVLWRQRLPTTGAVNPLTSEELVARYRTMFEELGKDLLRTLSDPQTTRAFLASRGVRFEDAS